MMLKRITCLLMALIMLFSLSAEAFAESAVLRASKGRITVIEEEPLKEGEETGTAADPMPKEQSAREKTLRAADEKNYAVTVSFGAEAGLPDNVELQVKELLPEDEDYAAYLGRSAELMKEKVESLAPVHVYDLSMEDQPGGKTWQPNDKVKVNIRLLNEQLDKDTELAVVCFPGSLRTEELQKKAEDRNAYTGILLEGAELLKSTTKNGTVSFETEVFCVYVVAAYPPKPEEKDADNEARINGGTPMSLAAALAAVSDGQTIELLIDVTLTDALSVDYWRPIGFTLDLGGYTLTVNNDAGITFHIGNNDQVYARLQNGTLVSNLAINNCQGTLILGDDLTVNGTVSSSGKLAVSGATLNGSVNSDQGGTVTINSGSISGNVSVQGGGALTISGGTIGGNVSATNTNTTMSGGMINGNLTIVNQNANISGGTVNGDVNTANATVGISGGTFNGHVNGNGGNLTISGGSFQYPPEGATTTGTQLTITANSVTRQYDGTALTLPNDPASVTAIGLQEGHRIDSITITGSQTNVGASACVPSAAVIKNEDTDVSSSYIIVYQSGTLTVTKATPAVTAPAARVLLANGSAQELVTAGSTTGGTLLYSLDNANYSAQIPTGTEAGTYTVYYKVEGGQNYENTEAQTVSVTIYDHGVTVTITGAAETVVYDGEAHSVSGYTAAADDETYDLASITFSGAAEAARTDAGTTAMGLTAEQFSNTDPNFSVVIFKVTDGYVTITPAPVTVTADDASKEYGDADPAYTVSVTGLVAGDDASLIACTFTREAGENVGSYAVAPTGEAAQGNYSASFVPGTLTITPASVMITADNKEKLAGDVDPVFTATVSGLKNGDPESVIAYTLSREEGETKGDYDILVTAEPVQGNYYVRGTHATLSIRPITVTFYNGDEFVRRVELKLNEAIGSENLAEVTKTGCDFKGWYNGDELITETSTFTEDTRLDARFSVTVRFVSEGTTVAEITVDEGAAIGALPDGTLEGCTFTGWYVGDEKLTESTLVYEHTTATARYTVTVTFLVKDGDGNVMSSNSYVLPKGGTMGANMPQDPVLTGYRFLGWRLADNSGIPTDTEVTAATTFSAHATVIAKFNLQISIVFLTEGTRHEFVVDYGESVAMIENPIRTGYRFDGWFKPNPADPDNRDSDIRVTTSEGVVDGEGNLLLDGEGKPIRTITATENMELYAHFVEQINVRFVVVHPSTKSSAGYPSINNEASFIIDKTAAGAEIPADFYAHTPAVSGYNFAGWYHVTKVADDTTGYDYDTDFVNDGKFVIDGEVYVLDESRPVTAGELFYDNTYVAAKLVKEVTLTFRFGMNGDEYRISNNSLVGDLLSKYYLPLEFEGDGTTPHGPAYIPGYRIEWLRDGNPVPEDYVILASDDNAVFDARYIQQVTASFLDVYGDPLLDGEGNPVKNTVDINTALGTMPAMAAVIGSGATEQHFMGWFDDDGRLYTAETILTEDVTLRPKYGFKVTFKVDGNDTWEFVRLVEPNTALRWLPAAPYREGSNFRSWTLDSVVVDETLVITKPVTLIGYYDDVSIYTITIHYMVGTEINDTKILSVDKSAVSETSPVEVMSPVSFTKEDGTYYPVMQNLQIVPDDATGLGVKNKHAEVTLTVDSADAQKITVTVPYHQANASYTVRYMLKNLNNNNYQPIVSVILQGVIGASVTPTVKDYDYAEFESLETGTIVQASGQVFNVYYTRKNFTLTYDTRGGRNINSVTELYGTAITLPTATSDPKAERDGYTFAGWYNNAECTGTRLYNLTLETDTTLYAKWTAKNVSYTVVYMFEKYNDTGTATSFVYDSSRSSTGQVGATVYASSAPTITRKGWEYDTAKNASSSVVIEANSSSVLYVYYKLTTYTFTFTINNDSTNGRYRMTIKNTTYRADYSTKYSFTAKLGQAISADWPNNGDSARIWDNGNNNRYYFYYWTCQGTNYASKIIMVTAELLPSSGSNVTVTGTWRNNNNTVEVNYHLQNANDNGYTKSTEYSQLAAPYGNYTPKEISGYKYDHSSNTNSAYNFYYNRETFKIDYYYGSTKLKTIENIKFDATIVGSTYNWTPTAAQCGVESDYSFAGWYENNSDTPYNFSTMPASNIVLYAKWNAPSYTVKFHLNFDGASPEPYFQRVQEKHKSVTDGLSDTELNALNHPTPVKQYHSFEGWYTAAEGGDPVDVSGQFVTGELDYYAHWKPNGVSYTVNYWKTGTTEEVLPSKTVVGEHLKVGDVVTEYAPYVAGLVVGEDDTMVADAGKKTIILDYEDNVITFYYDKKPDTIYYAVHYVLYSDHEVHVAASKTHVPISGDYTSITETAAAPTVAGYTNYRPTEVTKTLELGRDEAQNVLYFYYTKGAKLTVQYLDMEGDPIQTGVEEYLDVGQTYALDTAVAGYALDHIEKNGVMIANTETSFTAATSTDEFEIKVYYKKNLYLMAHSANKAYDGNPLTLAPIPANITADGLKAGHTITGVTLTGSRTEVGVSRCEIDPDSLVISGLRNGLTAAQFYNIYPVSGALTVTKINVIVSLEPDRWTGNVYDGTYKATGFTNGRKKISGYIIISNKGFEDAYLQTLWDNLMTELLANGRGYVEVPNALTSLDDVANAVTGLQILNQRDAGDYYEESSIFLTAAQAALAALPAESRTNYNVILYVRESRLEINPAPLLITTGSAEKPYDGTALTNGDLTVTARGTVVAPSGSSYTVAEGDTITVTATGSQLTPGESQNIYEINWGGVNPENFNVSENLGTLTVTRRKIKIEAVPLVKPLGEDDPKFELKVSYKDPDTGEDVEIPAIVTRWTDTSYTVRLNDPAKGYIDNIAVIVSREAGEVPGSYVITPSADPAAVYNYDIEFVSGSEAESRLSIVIARVSNDGGATWTYHEYLVNDSYVEGTSPKNSQGAFDKAKSLSGDVIVETICETAVVPGESLDRYALTAPVDLRTGSFDSLTLRTSTEKSFTSIISRGADFGSLFQSGKNFTVGKIILEGKKTDAQCTGDGGLVNVTGGTLTLETGAVLRNSKSTGSGGAVYVASGGALTVKGTIRDCEAVSGGAIYVASGGTMTMIDGSIIGGASTGDGAGVYLASGAKLNLSGNPRFDGNLKAGTLEGKKNGGVDYTQARQDIFLAETGETSNAITVAGAITSARGSIWVWADHVNHYEMLRQFAVFGDGMRAQLETAGKLESSLAVFRNAQTDDLTLCGGDTYLTGTLGENAGYIYWTGGYNVKFLKIDGFGVPQAGAGFALYKLDGTTVVKTSALTDDTGIVLFEKVPTGVYYLQETTVPANYRNSLSEDGFGNPIPNRYIVLVGENALKKQGLSAAVATVLADITVAENERQAALHKNAFGDDYDKYAIFLLDSDSGRAVTTPDIGTYGVMNIAEQKRPVILSKIDNQLQPVFGASLTLLRYDRTVVAENLRSDDSGVFYIGQLPYGVYLVQETTTPSSFKEPTHYFVLKITPTGVTTENDTPTNTIRESTSAKYEI